MPGIITITLNPAIDKSTTVQKLVPERKLACTAPTFEPGGGGVNVARAIQKLGGNAKAIYLAGGHTGKFYDSLLQAEGVSAISVPIAGHTRENLIVTDMGNHAQYRLDMPGPWVNPVEWQHLLEKIREIDDINYIVASGSLAPGVPADIFASFSAIAAIKGARFIVDTSGEALKQSLREGAYLVKPNVRELAGFAGVETLSQTGIIDVAKEIISKHRCEVVVVSMGETGAMLITAELSIKIPAPGVTRVSTVGAGDSMLAGIVYSLSAGTDILEAVQFGVACGTAATLNPGTALCKKEDAQVLFGEVCQQQSFMLNA
ncbi:1-phosphofructokinase family hexose kinase [Chitinophaga polysaccharea]|uniref:1-phosphofructokinase family hexose kinase n=1 Tax=Chitinophaga polysaccharea TaxID=1293035 RepID=UPI0014552377|nr:1-phosphofructokinase family hexose kinase [Chitinophaga polysaccharea]NLR60339.1 1-phosphofructokinase family hexose kinase [Chitinophaga polysaccharea]